MNLLNNKYFFSLLLFSLAGIKTFAQGPVLTPLNSNPQIKKHLFDNPSFIWKPNNSPTKKTNVLNLPFFEDFSRPNIYPNSNFWMDNYVYVNGDLAINPPSYGVATFDGLDQFGNPYDVLDFGKFGAADTLSSAYFDLSPFTIANGLFLSFFYQPQGRNNEAPGQNDSLILQFKNDTGAWFTVWKATGSPLTNFKQVMLQVNDNQYIHDSFQFRFINYMNYIGNLKHWHIDYIYFDRFRVSSDTIYNDMAIVEGPSSILRKYSSLPWKHFSANPNFYLDPNNRIKIANLFPNDRPVVYSSVTRDENNDIALSFDIQNGQNVSSKEWRTFTFQPTGSIPNLNTDSTVFKTRYLIDPGPADDYDINDTVYGEQIFSSYYAYDDGSPETGFGLLNAIGSVALGYDLIIPDTLRGISIYFTQAQAPVSNFFNLRIWSELPIPGQGTQEKLIYNKQIARPVYTDSIANFAYFELDQPIYASGKVWVGWNQNQRFLLNVGWDFNYQIDGIDTTQLELYYNVVGFWEKSRFKGTPMIRLHVGKKPEPVLSKEQQNLSKEGFKIYPNPNQGKFCIKSTEIWDTWEIYNINGVKISSGNTETIDISDFPSSIYFIKILNQNNIISVNKLIKQ